jgi:hypothetical protein
MCCTYSEKGKGSVQRDSLDWNPHESRSGGSSELGKGSSRGGSSERRQNMKEVKILTGDRVRWIPYACPR